MANYKGRPPVNRTPRQPAENTIMGESEDRTRFQTSREPDRISHEIETRARDNFYDLPDIDDFDYNADTRKLQLIAPTPRIDERHGKMRQHWVAHKHNNGHRIQQLMEKGYRVRHPDTIPPSFQHFTEAWQGKDVIMVAGEHILMEIPETRYLKLQQAKFAANNAKIQDIKSEHGKIVRDGEVQSYKDKDAGSFSKEIRIDRDNSGGDVSFAD